MYQACQENTRFSSTYPAKGLTLHNPRAGLSLLDCLGEAFLLSLHNVGGWYREMRKGGEQKNPGMFVPAGSAIPRNKEAAALQEQQQDNPEFFSL